MSIFQGDAIVKQMIDQGIDDIRKNPWLIDHMLEDFTGNPYLAEKYGKKQIDACREWLANNQIDVYMFPRDDRDRTPFISITMGQSSEKLDMRTEGDRSTGYKTLYPNQIGRPIPYIVKPFIPTDYDQVTGGISVPDSVDLSLIAPQMILVNPANGTGYIILGVSDGQIMIAPNQFVPASELGVLPHYQFYQANIGRSFFEESYNIECHSSGDIQTVMWLWSIAVYSLLRYRQGLLEANGFAESIISSGPPMLNSAWTTEGGEKFYVRSIELRGQVQNSWISAPHRLIENVRLGQPINCDTFEGGIKILSNLNSPPFIASTPQSWTTAEDTDEE